jgi:ABC-type oligopeptide transport system substrate-binding subunit
MGTRYVSLNTRIAPLNDVNIRKGILAGFDREALRRSRGGAVAGEIATHFLPPAFPGYEEGGGAAGTGVDFLAHPRGDRALALSYFRKASRRARRLMRTRRSGPMPIRVSSRLETRSRSCAASASASGSRS